MLHIRNYLMTYSYIQTVSLTNTQMQMHTHRYLLLSGTMPNCPYACANSVWWEGKRDGFVVTAMHRIEDCFAVPHKTDTLSYPFTMREQIQRMQEDEKRVVCVCTASCVPQCSRHLTFEVPRRTGQRPSNSVTTML